jgi:hypothetical protein
VLSPDGGTVKFFSEVRWVGSVFDLLRTEAFPLFSDSGSVVEKLGTAWVR